MQAMAMMTLTLKGKNHGYRKLVAHSDNHPMGTSIYDMAVFMMNLVTIGTVTFLIMPLATMIMNTVSLLRLSDCPMGAP